MRLETENTMKSVRRWLSKPRPLRLLGIVLIGGGALFGAAAQASTVTYVYTDAQGAGDGGRCAGQRHRVASRR